MLTQVNVPASLRAPRRIGQTRRMRIQGRSHRSGWSGFNPTTFLASMITLESNLQAVTVPQYRRVYHDLWQARGYGY